MNFGLNVFKSIKSRSRHRRGSVGEGALKNFAKVAGNTCARVSFLIKLQAYFQVLPFYRTRLDVCFFRKRTLAEVYLCKRCEIFRVGGFAEHFLATTSNKMFFLLFADQRGLQPKINISDGAIVKLEKEFTSPFSSW